MIKINEIHFGSLVEFEGDYRYVAELFSISNNRYWKGIPLKKEGVLEMCGFEQLDYGYQKTHELTTIIRLIVSDGYFYPQIEEAPEMSHQDTQIVSVNRIEYVHELQHLWRVVTGEELKTKNNE